MSIKARCFQLMRFGDPLQEQDLSRDTPQGRTVLLRVVASGVCHSDLHICEGFQDLGGGKKLSFEGRVPLPLTLGHEISGEVVAVGPDVVDVAVGDQVLVCSWIGCGECIACRADREHQCRAPRYLGLNRPGGYADFVTVPHDRYLIKLDGLDPQRAAPLVCSGLTSYGALKKLDANYPLSAQKIVIVGAGGLGLMALCLSQMMGAAGAIVVEINPARRQAALDAGAMCVIDPNAPGAQKAIRQAAGGEVLGVVDFVGSAETCRLGFDLLGIGGKLVVVGLFGGAVSLPVPMIPSKSAKIEGCYVGTLADLKELIALVREKGMPAIPIDLRQLADVNTALDDLSHGRVVGRVVLIP